MDSLGNVGPQPIHLMFYDRLDSFPLACTKFGSIHSTLEKKLSEVRGGNARSM